MTLPHTVTATEGYLNPMPSLLKTRVESIDVLRGIVMIIMALDHTRDFFHPTAWTDDPLNLATTTPALFFTRWITHFCAPIFVFLSGTSIYLQGLRKSKNELSAFLLKRGLWLIAVEVLIVVPGFSFLPYNFILLQVLWAIGISMVLMAGLTRLPYRAMLLIGFVIVLGHNGLDFIERAPDFKPGFWWQLLHDSRDAVFPVAEDHIVIIGYPFVPWLGLMMLGYGLGRLFEPMVSPHNRRQWLLYLGAGAIGLFVGLRFLNGYGDPYPWSLQTDTVTTLLSFLKVHKYPPSLLYIGVTIGVGLLALAFLEKTRNGFTRILRTYGRTAFFYYIVHWYVLHTLRMGVFFADGHTMGEAIKSARTIPMLGVLVGQGVSLPAVYLIWLTVVAALYPLCRWYDAYKTAHKEQWWLSYV